MKTIEQLTRECDLLASRYYRLDSGSKERAASDWLEQVRKTVKMINIIPFQVIRGGKE